MRSILLTGSAREGSSRTKKKMTRPFGDSCLYEIYLKKLEEISHMKHPFCNIIMAINRKDKTLWEMSKNSDIEIVERSDHSITQGTERVSEIYQYLENFDADYVIHMNGCFPFLKPETVIKLSEFFQKNDGMESMICARERHNYFWDIETHEPINNRNKNCLSTKLCPPLLESVNSIVIYNRNYMFETDSYWNYSKNNPYIYVIPDDVECLDIDTEYEFMICEAVWQYLHNEKK